MAKKTPRRLFLDDDPARARVFLELHPDAVWVQTVPDCVAKLAEPWDEVHLDHDLGGEQFVDVNREDCGMEVVRWLTRQPRTHLRRARFTIHSHNIAAAFEMAMILQALGYRVDTRPFGIEPSQDEPISTTKFERLKLRARTIFRRLRGTNPWDRHESNDHD